MYEFVIGAIFKNESHIIKEWLEHYFYHGVDHIYLINDNSSDNFMDILLPFINKNLVTLYDSKNYTIKKTDNIKYVGMQWAKYNFFFKKHFNECMWFGIFDLDEFLYSPKCINIKNILNLLKDENQICIQWIHFGSSGHIKQPENVVNNFLYRAIRNPDPEIKSIIKSDYGKQNISLRLHKHRNYSINLPENPKEIDVGIWHKEDEETFFYKDQQYKPYDKSFYNATYNNNQGPLLLINHYRIQSLEFWKKVKMTRGDAECWYDYLNKKRDIDEFNKLDINEVRDTTLKEQNKFIKN